MDKIKEFLRMNITAPLAREAVRRSIVPVGLTVGAACATADSVSIGRVLVCLAVVLLAPVVVFAPLRTLVARRSNMINAMLLASFVLVDLLSGFIAVRWTIAGWLSAAVLLTMTVGGLFYNVWMMSFALKLETN